MACTGVLQNNAEKAKDYHNRAISASSYKLWLDRRVFDAQVIDQNAYPPPLETQINSVISKLEDYGDRHKRFEADWKRVTDGLIAKEADYFEPALRNLGSYLGFDTDRPTGRETPDGIWRLLNYCHVFEMKTNIEDPDGSIPLGDIRQTFLHDRWVKQNRPVGPDEQIFIVLICAKKHVPQFAAHATEGITLVDPQTIVEIAERAGTLLRTTLDKLKFSNQEDAKITLASLLQELQLDCFSIHETFRQKKLTDVVN